MSQVNIQMNKSVIRELQKQDGAFDGRFRVRRIKNKKREASKNKCRGKVMYQ